MEQENAVARAVNKLYGGIDMTWPKVLILSVASAVITDVFLLVPVFKNTSFERMGVYLEAWVFLAIFIMANCKKPLESALKTFVFFLISQPLIYLFEVPFVDLGWGIFGYYKYWFILTLLTFPAAFAGWFITKRNWLSVVILSPMIVLLTVDSYDAFGETIKSFPHLIITGIFCVLQIVVYFIAFFPGVAKKVVGGVIVVATVIAMVLFSTPDPIEAVVSLPGNPSYSEEAVIEVDVPDKLSIQFHNPEEGMVYVFAHEYGSTDFTVTDDGQETMYRIEITNDNGVDSVVITEVQE